MLHRAARGKTTPVSQSRPPVNPDVQEAARSLAREYGVDKLAPLTGISAGTLYNKINAHDEGAHLPHKVALSEAVLWSVLAQHSGLSNPARILHAFAHALGHVALPVPDLAHVADDALLEMLTRVGKEGGDFHAAIGRALADRVFSAQEMHDIEREAYEWVAAILETVGRMRGLVDE